MSHRAAGPLGGAPRLWALPGLILLALVVLVGVSYLSRALLLDLIAWWPVWLVLAVLAVTTRKLRVGRVRVAGMIPIVVAATLAVFIVGHLAGWRIMPSVTTELVGPPASSVSTAALAADIDGKLVLRSGEDFLYRVEAVRRGGGLGIPDATEQTVEDTTIIELHAPAAPGLLAFSGWEVRLSTSPSWSLSLGGEIDADLTGLRLQDVQAKGKGVLRLGIVDAAVPVAISGDFTVVLPPGAPARVVGEAEVPEHWEDLTDGSRSPESGNAWVISVAPEARLTVVQPGPASG